MPFCVPLKRSIRKQGTARRRILLPQLSTAILVLFLACATTGCLTGMRAESDQPVKTAPLKVFVGTDLERYLNAKLGILLFQAPSFALSTENTVTHAYLEELLRTNAFQQVEMLDQPAKNDEEAIWWGRQRGCDLVMRSSILYLLDGSGAMPTQLQVQIRILDVRSGTLVWDVQQKAYSEPGKDIDLFWTTWAGGSGQRYPALATRLAEQFSSYLLGPLTQKGKK